MRITAGWIALFFLPFSLNAAFPTAVDGQPLPSLAPMLERVTPAVVNIATQGRIRVQTNPLFDDPFFRQFFNAMPRTRETKNLGSGVVIDANKGLVITNHHVIAQAEHISVTLRDGRHFEAKLIGSDEGTDIAVLQIEASELTEIQVANSHQLRVGDFVVAIGNPFGLGQTVTSGIVSALGRSGLGIHGYEDFIQTDASINVGNSGGALVNLRGELVGINTAILAPNKGSIGIGFAIPSNVTLSILSEILAHGRVRRGLLGVATREMNSLLAERFGLPDVLGAIVIRVAPNSPAEQAGLKGGDILTRIGEYPIRNSGDVSNAIGLSPVDQLIDIEVIREETTQVIQIVLRSKANRVLMGKVLHPGLKGFQLGNIDKAGDEAVVVLKSPPQSAERQLKLLPGDIIIGVNGRRVHNLTELADSVRDSHWFRFNVIRHGQQFSILVR